MSRSGGPPKLSLDSELEVNGLKPYALRAPSWQAPWLAGDNDGYPGFFPTSTGQEEDQLSETAVKSGFVGKAVVQVS